MSLEVPARAPAGRRGHDKQRATLHNIQSYNDLFDWIHFTQKQIQGFQQSRSNNDKTIIYMNW